MGVRLLKRYLLLAFAIFYPLGSAHAQHALVLQKLKELNEVAPALNNTQFESEILGAVDKIYGSNDACSKSEVSIEQVRPATAERFVFSAVMNGRMRNAWTVTARVPGCDTAPVRFMIMQNMDKSLKTIRVNRGASYAWDSLIGDTLPFVSLVSRAALKRKGIECGETADFKLSVIRIASEEKDLGEDLFGVRYTGGWREIWPIKMCGRTVEVMVRFTADGDGGAYYHIPGDQIVILTE